MTHLRLARLAAVAAIAFAAGPAQAQSGGVLGEIFGAIGLGPRERPAIDYRERPPLVVPPNLQSLPSPAGETAAADPRWPNDPDVAAARARAALERVPVAERGGFDRSGERMTVEELRSGRVAGAGLAPGANAYPDNRFGGGNSNELWIPPGALREADARARAEQAEAARLERRFLTDPPQAFLRPDPGAPMPTSDRGRSRTSPEPMSPQEWNDMRSRR